MVVQSIVDLRALLHSEFIRRCKKNSRYSMRAFAQFLEIDHSTVSKILKGTRKINPAQVQHLGSKLGLNETQIETYLKSVTKNYHELTLDTYQIIGNWYHHAVFELVTIRGFQCEAKWISKKLNISVGEAGDAIERLKRVGLIEEFDGKWRQSTPFITTTANDFTNQLFRNLQKEFLNHSVHALDKIPYHLRDHSGMTMAINSKKLNEAKLRLRSFRRKFCDYLQKDSERDSVYQLSVSFFPLSNGEIS